MARPVRDMLALLFARKIFYKVNRQIVQFGLRNLGVFNLNHKYDLSGESWFIKYCYSKLENNSENIIFDVGANIGEYSKNILEIIPNAKLYAFEPHPVHYEVLKNNFAATVDHINIVNKGCGDTNSYLKIYDIRRGGEEFGYTMDRKYLEWLKNDDDIIVEKDVEVIKLDDYILNANINKINLMKIDVEGFELNVLKGCREAIKNNLIDIVQFEFNVHNIDNKLFMRDFFELLSNYKFYRLLPRGLLPIKKEDPPYMVEIFGYQNIIAINSNVQLL